MESPTSSFSDLIKQYELSHRCTKKKVSDAHLELISRSYCEEWKSLPPYLKLETVVANDIDRSAKTEREKRHDFLFEWKEIKGSAATYKQLITALLHIKRRQDAEKVCELLKESICPKPLAPSDTSDTACAMPPTDTAGGKGAHSHALSPDKFEDLKLQLSIDLQKVIGQYSTYVSFIRETLEEKGVSVKDLRSYLMTMSAFSNTDQKLALVSAHKEELEEAGDLNTIFDLLVTEYASFLNYDIFRSILEKFQKKYQIPPGQEELKYPEHLNAYIKRHKVSEFIEVNPLLKEYTEATSRELVLKIDIESTSRLAVLANLKAALAKVLGLKPATLRLLDIKEGCVAATYLIPTPVAKLVFSERTVLTDEQKRQLQALSALRMECNNCVLFDWTEKTPDPMSHANLRPKYNFIQELDEDLKCAICSNVAEDPIQHVTCGKLFCKDCLGKHGNDKPCPHCKTEGAIFYPDTRSKNAIQSLGVKCTYMVKGCQWEGTLDTLQHHVSTCSHQEEDTPPVNPSHESNKPQCYVFIDNSNLWIPGQKASGKKLKDADFDARFRVDHGRFLNLVQKDRHLNQAILYGSIPPPNDTVWKAVREKNFIVKVYKRSESGRAKEIYGSMALDIMTTLHTKSREDVTYVIVTGDRNLNPIIVDVLSKGVPVELWSWEAALAREFRQLANTHGLFTVTCLDAITDQFGFTAFMSNRLKRDIDPAHAIVYRDLPAEENVKLMLANHMHRLWRLFYITCVQSQAKGKENYIVEFPRSNPEVVLKQLQQLGGFRYQPCSYPEYTMGVTQHHQPIATTNRFEVFDPDSDYESLPDEAPYVEQLQSAEYEADISNTFDIFQWTTENRSKPGRMSRAKRTRETPCKKRDHCPETSACLYQHTEEELRLFARLPNIKFQYFKTKKCDKIDQHLTPGQRKWCRFAHEGKDSWCLKCHMYGHLTDDCKVKK